jgi:chromosome segregation ATPase
MSIFLQSPVLLGVSAFMAGWVIAYVSRILAGEFGGGAVKGRADSEHVVRALEADLRIALKAVEDAQEELADVKAELRTVNEESDILQKTLVRRDAQLAEAKKDIAEECLKTVDLRKELSGRAEETIRAKVQIKNIETELDVVQAGSKVVADQFRRLEEEREDLTGRLRALNENMPVAVGDEPEESKKFEDQILDS